MSKPGRQHLGVETVSCTISYSTDWTQTGNKKNIELSGFPTPAVPVDKIWNLYKPIYFGIKGIRNGIITCPPWESPDFLYCDRSIITHIEKALAHNLMVKR